MPGNAKLPSISRRLTVSLIVSVAIVSVTMIGLNYFRNSREEKKQLTQKADEYISFLADSLRIPLWNFETETIRHIGSAYSQNELIGGLKITDSDGKIYFSTNKNNIASPIERRRNVTYNELLVGTIELTLTSRFYADNQKLQLRQSIIAIIGIIIAIIVVTGFLLRLFLKRPLEHLSELIGTYTSGQYATTTSFKYQTCMEFEQVVTVLDDMSQKISEQMSKLQAAEEKYRSIVDSANEAILTLNTDGTITSWNSGATKIFGYKPDEIVGQNVGVLVPEERKNDDQQLVTKALDKEPLTGHETIRVRKDGSRFPVELSLGPLKNDREEVVGLSEIIRDTTERTESEKRFKEMEQRLFQSQKLEAIGTLAGGIAHDFNNILAAVIGYAELMQLALPVNSQESDYTRQIIQAGSRAKDLVQQILTFSRQTELELKPIEVSTIVKEVTKLLRSSMPTTIEIRQNIQGNTLVMGDPTQLYQILMNLCTNAGHAMQEGGGVLTIELQRVDLQKDVIGRHQMALKPGKYVRLTVSDTGKGIAAEYIDRVFDPFFTTKERGKGTGMGLSVVHGIVQSYNGVINVQSEEGKGSTFTIYLPAIERQIKPDIPELETIPKGSGNVLFVDDEPILVEMSAFQLKALGYTVRSRSDSLSALALFKDNPEEFDLVITDATMPKMTGDELAKEIKNIRPDIPVILCTGFSSKVTPDNIHEFNIDAFLMKPIVIEEMARVVHDAMTKKKSL